MKNMTQENSLVFSFETLEIYQDAKAFFIECRTIAKGLRNEIYIGNQLLRASLSVSLNLAEGSGKFTKRDRRNFAVIARASLFECVALLDILKVIEMMDEEKYQKLKADADRLSRRLYVMINNLSK